MKKNTAIRITALLLSALTLFGCSKAGTPTNTESTSETTPTQTTEVTTAPVTPEKDNPAEIDKDGSYITADYSSVSGDKVLKYPRLTNLPTLYITLERGKKVGDIQHGVYMKATYTMVDTTVEDSYYERSMQIKGRGNYSWSFQHKPYSLKLDEKANLIGMGAAKKWVLVTVSSDRTMLRNYLTQKMAKHIGLPSTCDNEYCDVVVNGKYLGTYVLTEKIQIHENRVNVVDEKSTLFEIEMVYRHSCECCIVMYEDKKDPGNSIHLKVLSYKGLEPAGRSTFVTKSGGRTHTSYTDCKNDLNPYFEKLQKAMQSGDYNTLKSMMDMDSFINWYLLNDLARNYDSAFVTSDYCYIDENGIIHMGPCWDYDTPYGSQDGTTTGSRIREVAAWYRWMFGNCPEFVDDVKTTWTEKWRVKDGYLDWFKSMIDITRKEIAQSEQLEHTKYTWSEVHDYGSYNEAITYMKNWLEARIKWLDGEYLKK